MSDKIREDFEKWAATHEYLGGVPLHRGCRGDYADIDLQHAFDAWQASRESLVIDLGKPDVEEWSEALITVHYGWSQEAIEAAGLKVKS